MNVDPTLEGQEVHIQLNMIPAGIEGLQGLYLVQGGKRYSAVIGVQPFCLYAILFVFVW